MTMKTLTSGLALGLVATPALAAKGPFFSLANTDFIVLIAFILFIAVLFYFKVPGMLSKMLDDRSNGIQSELDEARSLRDEAQALLASYERKHCEVQEQADKIVAASQGRCRSCRRSGPRRSGPFDRTPHGLRRGPDCVSTAAAIKEVRDTGRHGCHCCGARCDCQADDSGRRQQAG